jgi:hypothetical protein
MGISNQCLQRSDCASDQVCCAGAPSGGDAGAATGLGGFLAALSTTCQTSCMPGQQQPCTSSTECPPGETCQGVFGLGALGGVQGLANVNLMLPNVCAPARPDAGAPQPDASSPAEAGTTPDAGVDTGTTTVADAGTD